ncbi:Gfo/Idh/MocA family protein [Paenibacillus radicis (ex Xue et al. 2023)]|uniref:Gfo/Idh/MocA family oxidoreductase n=1 Tax=Paenibacillus radicis (ex Xue et al. 2023) TaxID=2972489 RepID=A0ABT1YQ56_9BACL|nr:Gfo/Idh/MocA family oxidoreductase [Paenibacillus radicis (ex Xue et al. 2023)]MCR8635312.1 Gfo/Idh/MocA family oxidoreductase [Paenibacillus radicis (ex Xue et al. 2023)]
MKKIIVGIIGSGFSASLHAEAFQKVYGVEVILKAVAGNSMEKAEAFAHKHHIPIVYSTYRELLEDKEIDVVDLCVPNVMHAQIAIEAAQAGKHIICEKPITGFFGSREGTDDQKNQYSRVALEEALASTDAILEAVKQNKVKFMYAENWIYAPSVIKAKRLLEAGSGTILDIRAEESHSGSHAKASKRLETAGGGSLLILGSHPIAAAIHLKNFEGRIKGGKPIRVQSVVADTSSITETPSFQAEDKHWVVTDWVNVETWASIIMTFTDGTKAVIFASFAVLGGIRNVLDIYTSNSVIKCNMTPNDGCMIYAPHPDIFEQEYIAEKLETKAGWNYTTPDEDWIRGYPQEMQDFMESIAEDREPVSDGQLARDVIEVIYSAYVSAQTGTRVELAAQ